MQLRARAYSFRWLYVIILVNLALVVATWIVASSDASATVVGKLLKHLTLAMELNVATWWSMSLLWLTAVLAYELFATQTQMTRAAWLVLACLFALLSWDEIGSFHERIGDDGWDGLKPFMVVIGLLLAFVSVTLFKTPSMRRASGLIVLGIVILGLIPLQEYLTQTARLWPDNFVGVAVAVEEGAELLGMSLCLLGVARWHRRTDAVKLAGVSEFPRAKITHHFVVVSLVILILALVVAYATGTFTDIPRRGDPTVWTPSIIFLTLAITVVRARRFSGRSTRVVLDVMVLFCLGLSLGAVYILGRRYLDAVPAFTTGLLVGLLVFCFWRLLHSASRTESLFVSALLLFAITSYVLNSFGMTSIIFSTAIVIAVHEALRLRWRQSTASSATEINRPTSVHSATS